MNVRNALLVRQVTLLQDMGANAAKALSEAMGRLEEVDIGVPDSVIVCVLRGIEGSGEARLEANEAPQWLQVSSSTI